MRRSVEIGGGKALWVAGPASLTVRRGAVRVVGAVHGEGSRIIVPRYRSYTVEPLGDADLELVLGEGGEAEAVPLPPAAEAWNKAAVEAVERGGRILVLGPVESGKTTFTALVANTALSRGAEPAVIDGDVGQADIGPPAFASMASLRRPVLWLRELSAAHMAFVGHVSPGPAPGHVVSAVSMLARVAEGDPVVIDTDGWMGSVRALEYKYMLMEALEPSTIVLIGDRYAAFFEKAARLVGARLLVVPPPPSARRRSRGDRRALRREAYRRYLEGADTLELRARDLLVLGSCLYSGRPLSEAEIRVIEDVAGLEVLAGSRGEELVLVVERLPGPEGLEALREAAGQAVLIEKGWERGLLASIIGARACEQAPAIVEKVDYGEDVILARSKWRGEAGGIHIGRIRLNQDYAEERVTRCPI